MSTPESLNIQKPQLYVNHIIFNDNTEITLDHNSIVVFTGANNNGKSQVLKDIELAIKNPQAKLVVVNTLERVCTGDLDDDFLFTYLRDDGDGNYYFGNNGATLNDWKNYWKRGNLNKVSNFLMGRLDTKERLTVSESKQLYGISAYEQRNSLHAVYDDNKKEKLISDLFFDAFKENLVVNRRAGQYVSLHIGNPPNRSSLTMNDEGDFYAMVANLPKLDTQGDGMRSFASVLLDNFTTEKTLTLIDEPEAFLHPPQARLMGKMLAKHNLNERQLFISTHSEDFIQGLLDADNKNVKIIRINRKNFINHMSILNSEDIRNLWSNPILRYSNILSGLFHEKVIVCESDYDCLFYQAVLDAIYENVSEIAPDILFTHCGGKDRIKDVVKALKALNVPVVAVCDFDLLNDSKKFRAIVSAFDENWDTSIGPSMKIVYDGMNAKTDAWRNIKKIGKAGFTGNEPAAYEAVEMACKAMGLYIVPVGEMECFDKTINRDKKDWVYYVLENYNLATEPQLSTARTFIKSFVDFSPTIIASDTGEK